MPQYPAVPQNGGAAVTKDATSSIILTGTTAVAGVHYLRNIIINGVVGTGGALTLNDAATVGAAAAANQIVSLPGTTAVGTVLTLSTPIVNGLVVSAIPTGGTVSVRANYS